jgi:16S rRNA (guanine527-N7)-methyltransferase
VSGRSQGGRRAAKARDGGNGWVSSPAFSPQARGLLEAGVRELGLEAPPERIERCARFLGELERWNRAYGFVRATGEDLVRRHFLDSLAGLPAILELARRSRIGDLGSGAGFPGIPLALFLPQAGFTLVERSARRAAFLRGAALLLGLENVTVRQEELEAVQETFDVVTFRALTPLARELPALRRLAGPQGTIVAYKGRLERVALELVALHLQVPSLAVRQVRVPFLEEERHLVIFRPAPASTAPALDCASLLI